MTTVPLGKSEWMDPPSGDTQDNPTVASVVNLDFVFVLALTLSLASVADVRGDGVFRPKLVLD